MHSPIVEGGTYEFRMTATLDGLPWDLTGADVTLDFQRPDNTTVTRTATIVDAIGGVARYRTFVGELTPGQWFRQWHVKQNGQEIDLKNPSQVFSVLKALAQS